MWDSLKPDWNENWMEWLELKTNALNMSWIKLGKTWVKYSSKPWSRRIKIRKIYCESSNPISKKSRVKFLSFRNPCELIAKKLRNTWMTGWGIATRVDKMSQWAFTALDDVSAGSVSPASWTIVDDGAGNVDAAVDVDQSCVRGKIPCNCGRTVKLCPWGALHCLYSRGFGEWWGCFW